MTATITIDAVKARQSELSDMIAKLERQQSTRVLKLPDVDVVLRPGERYAGPVLNADGTVKHHLVTIAMTTEGLTWEQAKTWAAGVGGDLPDRSEISLIRIQALQEVRTGWYWTSEPEGSSCAWYCCFHNGCQSYGYRGSEGCAVAVRRF